MSLDVVESKPGRNGYLRKFPELAEFYEVSLRTVKSWAAEGREKNDICPLDDPEAMRGWWQRWHSSRPCPAGILKHVVAGRVEKPEPVAPVEKKELGNMEAGAAGSLARLEEMEIFLASKAQEPGQVKDWLAALTRLQLATTKFREEEEKAGRLVPKDLVSQLIRDFHSPIEQGIRGMYLTLCTVTGFPSTPGNEEAWGKACDKLFENFGKEIFHET